MATITTIAPAANETPPATAPDRPNRPVGATASRTPARAISANPISATRTPVWRVKAKTVTGTHSRAMTVLLPLRAVGSAVIAARAAHGRIVRRRCLRAFSPIGGRPVYLVTYGVSREYGHP